MSNVAKTWDEALARHSAAARMLSDTARSLDNARWARPTCEGKWSPAQVVEHLNKTYEVIIQELKGKAGIRVRSPWLVRQILRRTVLRSIYRKRELPRGARAPSELRPGPPNDMQAELVDRFETLAAEFECEAQNNRGRKRTLTHHIFGGIDLLKGIDFIAIHIEHHHRQLIGARN